MLKFLSVDCRGGVTRVYHRHDLVLIYRHKTDVPCLFCVAGDTELVQVPSPLTVSSLWTWQRPMTADLDCRGGRAGPTVYPALTTCHPIASRSPRLSAHPLSAVCVIARLSCAISQQWQTEDLAQTWGLDFSDKSWVISSYREKFWNWSVVAIKRLTISKATFTTIYKFYSWFCLRHK